MRGSVQEKDLCPRLLQSTSSHDMSFALSDLASLAARPDGPAAQTVSYFKRKYCSHLFICRGSSFRLGRESTEETPERPLKQGTDETHGTQSYLRRCPLGRPSCVQPRPHNPARRSDQRPKRGGSWVGPRDRQRVIDHVRKPGVSILIMLAFRPYEDRTRRDESSFMINNIKYFFLPVSEAGPRTIAWMAIGAASRSIR